MSHVSFFDAYPYDGGLWFSNYDCNAFMRWDLQTNRCRIIDSFPGVDELSNKLHRKIFMWRNKMVFIPFYGKSVHIYDMDKRSWEMIKIADSSYKIAEAFQYGEDIWMIPAYLRDPIRVVHLPERSSSILERLTDEVRTLLNQEKNHMAFDVSSMCAKDSFIYLAQYAKSKVIQIDCTKNEIVKLYSLPDFLKIQGISCKNGHFWLTPVDRDAVYLWDGRQEENMREFVCRTDNYTGRIPYINVVDLGENRVIVLPCHSKTIFILDITDGTAKRIVYPEGFKRCKTVSLFVDYRLSEQSLILFPRGGNGILKMDITTKMFSFQKPVLSCEDAALIDGRCRQIQRSKMFDASLSEAIGWEEVLKDFIEDVDAGKVQDSGFAGDIGLEIYNIGKREMMEL